LGNRFVQGLLDLAIVVRGYALGQCEKRFKPIQLCFAEVGHVIKRLPAAMQRADADH
jgi:hypothetical protein